MLIIGDSYASGKESDTGLTRGWADILNVPVEKRQGIGGSTAFQWANNIGGCLHKALGTLDDVLVVSLLGNDAQSSNFTPIQVLSGIENLHFILTSCMVDRKKAFIFLYPDPFFGKSKNTQIMIPMLNRAIRIASYGINSEFVDLGKILDRSCFDGRDIHPTRHGHEVIAEYMKLAIG